jgi:hypothetical protein
MRAAIPFSQVPDAAGGAFIFHEPLAQGFALAKETGGDEVELLTDC